MMNAPLCESHIPGLLMGVRRRLPPHPAPVGVPKEVQDFRDALGEVIADVRKGMGLSQEAFAAKLGLDQTTVAKAETGKHLWRLETWLQVSKALKVPFYELFRRAVEKDTRAGRGDVPLVVEALNPHNGETRLIEIARQLTPKGREELMAQAEACLLLFRHEGKIVPLLQTGKNPGSRKAG